MFLPQVELSRFAWKVVVALVATILVLAAAWYAHALRAEVRDLRARNTMLAVSAQAHRANQETGDELVRQDLERVRREKAALEQVLREVRREREKPTQECERVALAPVRDAVRGLRDLRSRRDGTSSSGGAPDVR